MRAMTHSARPLTCLALLALGACASPSDNAELVPHKVVIQDGELLSSTAALNHTYILKHNNGYIICSPPPPDAVFDQAEKADISVFSPSFGGTDSIGEGESTTEVEMAARTPALLMSRELMYRACEFSRNFRLDQKGAQELYLKTLDGIFKMWEIEAGNTNVRINDQIIENVSGTPGVAAQNGASGTGAASRANSQSNDEDTDSPQFADGDEEDSPFR
jgi:hypothetical protein